MTEVTGGFQATWLRFETYRLDGNVLRGAGEAYPFDLWAFLDEKAMEETSLPPYVRFMNTNTEDDVLAFAQRYGMLGLFGYAYPVPIWRMENHQEELMGFLDRSGRFTSLDNAARWLDSWPGSPTGQPTRTTHIAAALQGKCLTQLPTTYEPVELWLHEAAEMRETLTEPPASLPDSLLTAHKILQSKYVSEGLRGVQVAISHDERWQLRWRIASLLDALWLQAALHLAGKPGLRTCQNKACGNLFAPQHARSRYCSDYCRISASNRRGHIRRLRSKGESIEDIARRTHSSVADVEAWLNDKEED